MVSSKDTLHAASPGSEALFSAQGGLSLKDQWVTHLLFLFMEEELIPGRLENQHCRRAGQHAHSCISCS